MMNIVYFAQKLVEKLNSRMFAADPKQILIFSAKQIAGVSYMNFFFQLSACCNGLFHTDIVIPQFSKRWL